MIQLNQESRLPGAVMPYMLLRSIIFPIILFIIYLFTKGQTNLNVTVNGRPEVWNGSTVSTYVFVAALVILVLSLVYSILYTKMFSFVAENEKISITSGVLFVSTKVVDYKSIQNVSTKRGPLLMLFGLQNLCAFTSSPSQLVVTSNGRNTSTTYRPDISMYLNNEDAEQLRQIISKGAEVAEVRVVQ